MRKAFFGEKVESERHARRIADSSRTLAQLFQMTVGVFPGSRLEQFSGKPEHALGFVGSHQLQHQRLEVREHFDLRERLSFDWIHGQPRSVFGTSNNINAHRHVRREEIHIENRNAETFSSDEITA
jgi:hypothetical protein